MSRIETCYHTFIETYFELEERPKVDCERFCSKCLGEVADFTGRVGKDQLVSFLSTNVLAPGKCPKPSDVIKAMKEEKERLFHPEDVPNHLMFQIHALCLQLVAKGILAVSVKEASKEKIGTNKLTDKDLVISLPNGVNSRDITLPSYTIPEYWSGLTAF